MALIHQIDHASVDGIRVGKLGRNGRWRPTASCIVYRLGDTVIDTGPSREWHIVNDYFHNKNVKQVVITHYHEDHSGNGHHFQKSYDAKILSHPNGHHHLEEGFKLSLIRSLTFGKVKSFAPETLNEPLQLDSGNKLEHIHLPGHTDDMTCFLEPDNGWLFSGDLYISGQIKYMMNEENVAQLINSLETALTLDFDTLFCAHRGIIPNGKKALAKKLDTITSLREEVAHLHAKGLSIREITHRLLGPEDITRIISQFQMSKQNVIKACLKSL